MTAAPPPPGVYRISQYGKFDEPQILTLTGARDVTILPPNAVSGEKKQRWRLEFHGMNENARAIQNPADMFPSSSLSYEGRPEEGKKIIPGPRSDFPTRDWYIEPAPPMYGVYFIRTLNKRLGISLSDITMHPLQLQLSPGENIAWVFERLDD